MSANPVGRPRKEKKQTPEERKAYEREYNRREDVVMRRRLYMREYRRLRKAKETPEERRERLDYQSMWARQYRASKRSDK